MVISSWSDHREKWRGVCFSNGITLKSNGLRHRVTVVGAERSIPLRGTRTFCEGPAELQPHILGPAVLREQQILYHDLRRIARRGGIFFADPVLRGDCRRCAFTAGPVLASGGAPARYRLFGPAVPPCGRTFVGLNPADTPSAGAPRRPFRLGGLPGGCLVRRSRPAARRLSA